MKLFGIFVPLAGSIITQRAFASPVPEVLQRDNAITLPDPNALISANTQIISGILQAMGALIPTIPPTVANRPGGQSGPAINARDTNTLPNINDLMSAQSQIMSGIMQAMAAFVPTMNSNPSPARGTGATPVAPRGEQFMPDVNALIAAQNQIQAGLRQGAGAFVQPFLSLIAGPSPTGVPAVPISPRDTEMIMPNVTALVSAGGQIASGWNQRVAAFVRPLASIFALPFTMLGSFGQGNTNTLIPIPTQITVPVPTQVVPTVLPVSGTPLQAATSAVASLSGIVRPTTTTRP